MRKTKEKFSNGIYIRPEVFKVIDDKNLLEPFLFYSFVYMH